MGLSVVAKNQTLYLPKTSQYVEEASEGAASVFDSQALKRQSEEVEAREQELYNHIGSQLQMEFAV